MQLSAIDKSGFPHFMLKEFYDPVIYEDDIVIPISQSGEIAYTLAAIELAKSQGATFIGICNVVGSSIARATHAGSYTHAGPENCRFERM